MQKNAIPKILHKAIPKEGSLLVEIGIHSSPGDREGYKQELRSAIQQSREQQCPLYIKPKISNHGWKAEEAAELFCQVLAETDTLDMTIDIEDINTSTNNTRDFKNALIRQMHDHNMPIENRGASDKDIFINIIDNLIASIMHAAATKRNFDGGNKIKKFTEVKEAILADHKIDTQGWTEQIIKACSSRSSGGFHFFISSIPGNVEEFNRLLTASEFDLNGLPTYDISVDTQPLFGQAGEQPTSV